jgi:hypothetical protein
MSLLSPLISTRSPTMAAVVETIDRFGQVTSSQIRRLHYEGSPDGVRVRCAEHLRKLTDRGLIRRMPFRSTTNEYGAAEFVYTPPTSTAEVMRPHVHDVTELYVLLRQKTDLQYDPEEWSRRTWGSVELHPDALVKLPSGRAFLVEVDLSTERPSVLALKMNRYIQAVNSMDGGKFPYVLWTCRSQTRLRTIRSVIKARSMPELFKVCLFTDATGVILDGLSV